MANSKLTAAQDRAVFQVRLLREAKAARERYDATGELQDASTVAPHVNFAWMALCAAIKFAAPLVSSIEQLPKKFVFGGVTFRVIYPPEGKALLIDPDTETTLTAGFIGWADPMKAAPLTDANSPPTKQPDQP